MSEIPPPTIPPSTPPPPGGSYTPPPPPGGGSYNPPPPPPPIGGSGPGNSSDRTLMLVLSYLGILALIPLLTKKDDPEVQWHAKNGLALFIGQIVIYIALSLIARFMPFGWVAGCISCLLPLVFLVIWILCIMKALKGERYRIPVITDIAEKM
jgi:uncharacterized membrane protein